MLRRRLLAVLTAAVGLALVPGQAQAIVGGTDAPAGKYPSTANILIGAPGLGLFGCTGTLIAPEWVMSAGHCASVTGATPAPIPIGFAGAQFTVTVGGIKADGSDAEKLTVDEVIIPTGYLATQSNDVSLLRLSAPAKTAPTPIAGKGYEALWKPNVLTDVVGFGTTSSGGNAPDALQQVQLPIVPDADCAKVYDTFEAMTQICAGYEEGGRDSCQGDSGGPMYSRTGAGALLLVGSTSYGRGCAVPKTPGVYGRVADAPLREDFFRANAPEAVLDAAAGAVTTPNEVYDPATKTVSPGTPATTPAEDPSPATPPAENAAGPATEPSTASPTTPASPPSTTAAGTTTVAATTRTGFRAALAVDRTLRSTVRSRGLRFRLRCSASCSSTVRLVLDAASAKRLGLASRTIGTTTVTRDAAGRTTRAIKVRRALLRRVMGARGAKLSLVAAVSSAGARSTLTAPVRLAGR